LLFGKGAITERGIAMDAIVPVVQNFLRRKFADIPPEVLRETKKSILDTLAALVAGTKAPGCPEIIAQVCEWGGKEESTILNYQRKVPVFLAALANGTMARAVDFDDVFEPGTAHATASLVPTALAMAERQGGVDGEEFLTTLTLGIDLICRLGRTHRIPPGVSGMNVTFQYACFAATAVAGRILGLDEGKMLHAMGLAYSQTSGNSQNLLEGTLAIRFAQGLAAQAGVYAAIFAARGITAANEVLQGKFGYFPVYQRGEYNIDGLLNGLGKIYEGGNVTRKVYPCCMHTHAAIDGVLGIVKKQSLTVQDVERITVKLNQNGFNFVCLPPDKIHRPQTVPEAQFSLPYILATALLKGKVSLGDFIPEALGNPEVLAIASRVECLMDEDLNRSSQGRVSPAIVEIRTKGGQQYSLRVDERKGSPANPLTMEEVQEKYRQCAPFAAHPIPRENIEKAGLLIQQMEKCPDVTQLVKFL
jgi:2-methylcitrate dehydratase PrpD